jgi:hypothetical protein
MVPYRYQVVNQGREQSQPNEVLLSAPHSHRRMPDPDL